MLIGLRILLLVAGIGCGITLLGYAFTRNPRFLVFTKTIIKVTLLVAGALIAVILLQKVI